MHARNVNSLMFRAKLCFKESLEKHGWRSGKTLAPHYCDLAVRFPDSASHVSWVCCWFSPVLRGFFYGFSGFPPFAKINVAQKFQFDHRRGPRIYQLVAVTCYILVKQRKSSKKGNKFNSETERRSRNKYFDIHNSSSIRTLMSSVINLYICTIWPWVSILFNPQSHWIIEVKNRVILQLTPASKNWRTILRE
jgi:hypothetical protein